MQYSKSVFSEWWILSPGIQRLLDVNKCKLEIYKYTHTTIDIVHIVKYE
jgi:hypothetical protein